MFDIAVIDGVTYGSTGKLATNICNYLENLGLSVCFCYGSGPKPALKYSYKVDYKAEKYFHALMCRLTGLQGCFSTFATLRLIRYLKRNKTSKIFAFQLHGYYLNESLFFSYIKKYNIKLVYVMIDEYPLYGKCGYRGDCEQYKCECSNCPKKREYPSSWILDNAHSIYKRKEKEYIGLKKACFVGPQYLVEQAKLSPLTRNQRMCVLDEAIDTSFYTPRNTEKLREKLGISTEKKVIVCVAPNGKGYERKGVTYFIELAKRMEANNDIIFVHVGYTGDKTELPLNYVPIGFVDDQNELADFYSLGDLFVFPSLQDTMPNACLEALSCGTPLMCFNTSGMPYLGDESVLTLVEVGDVDKMADHIMTISKKTSQIIESCRSYALNRYSSKNYCEKLYNILSEL